MSFLGHKTNRSFYYIIGLLTLIIVALLVMYVVATNELKERQKDLTIQLLDAKAESAKYKQAYEIVLADAQAFDRIYGTGYRGESDVLDADINASAQNTNTSATPRPSPLAQPTGPVTLSDTDAWGFYFERGLIQDWCIETTKLVQTPTDVVDIVLIASSDGAALRLLVDAQDVARFDVAGNEQILKSSVVIPKGTHHIDIVYVGGAKLDISLVRIGDRTIESDISVLDFGSGFDVFDCEDTKQDSQLKEPGAMRMRIEKV